MNSKESDVDQHIVQLQETINGDDEGSTISIVESTTNNGNGGDLEGGGDSKTNESKSDTTTAAKNTDKVTKLPLFHILATFAVATIIIAAFDRVGKLKNSSMWATLLFAFGTLPLIIIVMIMIRFWKRNLMLQLHRDADAKKLDTDASPQGSEKPVDTTKVDPTKVFLQDAKSFSDLYIAAKEADEEKEKEESDLSYAEDIYSFLAFYDPFESVSSFQKFSFGMIVFLFQFSLLLMMTLNVVVPRFRNTGEVDNTDSSKWYGNEIFPSNSGYLVRATQVISIMAFVFFPEESVSDITTAFELWPKQKHVEGDDRRKVNGLRFSCGLRLIQGVTASLAVFLLVMTSPEVIDIILNFTAVNFISSLDNRGFELAKDGRYGKFLEDAVEEVKNEKLPPSVAKNCKRKRYNYGMMMTCFILYVTTVGVIVTQDNSGEWITPLVRVEFGDETRSSYSGCFHINTNKTNYRRYIYESSSGNQKGANIGYCLDQRRWLLFEGDDPDPCNAFGGQLEIAHSAKTDAYDIQASTSEDWFSVFNTPIDDMFFVEAESLEELEGTCGSWVANGECDNKLNNFAYQYDGGDCCATTCNGENCGKLTGDEIGYPFCTDPSMTNVTIHIDEDVETENLVLSLLCGKNKYEYDDERSRDVKFDTVVFNISKPNTEIVAKVEKDYYCKVVDNSGNWTTHGRPFENYTIFYNKANETAQYPLPIWSWEDSYKIPSKEEEVITHMDVAHTKLSGTIPREIGLMTDLTFLSLHDNAFTGSIPSEIGLLTGLTLLDLAVNAFTGTIPTEIGSLTGLTYLNVFNNILISPIPSEIAELTDLREMHISSNQFNGTIPIEYIAPMNKTLEWFSIDYTQISSTIPAEIGLMTALTGMNLHQTELSGPLPREIGELTNLNSLGLHDNSMTGSLPTEIGLLTLLTHLELHYNELTGTIPSEIGEMTGLENLKLYNNKLSGNLPTEVGNLIRLRNLDLEYNDLSGDIPTEIALMTALTALYLGHNELSGTIPIEIGNMRNLTYLNLRNSTLSGPIPSQIGLLNALTTLYIDDNDFSGTVPPEVEALTSGQLWSYEF